jgi:hypothetical protein
LQKKRLARSAHRSDNMHRSGPLEGIAKSLEMATTSSQNVDARAPRGSAGRTGSVHHSTQRLPWRALWVVLLLEPGALTTQLRDVDSGLPGRRCQRSESAHHSTRIRRWQPPWEAMSEIRECLPSTQKNVDGGALGRQCRRSGSAHHQRKKC